MAIAKLTQPASSSSLPREVQKIGIGVQLIGLDLSLAVQSKSAQQAQQPANVAVWRQRGVVMFICRRFGMGIHQAPHEAHLSIRAREDSTYIEIGSTCVEYRPAAGP